MSSKTHTITELILLDHSKKTWEAVAKRAVDSPEDLQELMACFFSNDNRLNQRSSQCISKVHDLDPDVISPYFTQLIDGLNHNCIDAYKRNVLRIFQNATIPESHLSQLFDLSLKFLLTPGEAIAIKAFSMTVLKQIAKRYPELSPEIIDAIEIVLEETSSAGIKSRGNKELKALKRLTTSVH